MLSMGLSTLEGAGRHTPRAEHSASANIKAALRTARLLQEHEGLWQAEQEVRMREQLSKHAVWKFSGTRAGGAHLL